MTDFTDLLSRFAKAVAANDGAGFAALFTEDGVYDDGFFGEYKGRKAIIEMLQHFHDTGSNYRWDFFDALSDGRTGYARYRFSYASGMPGAEGKPVVFEGTSHFVFRDGAIARYEEILRPRHGAGAAGFRRRADQEGAQEARRPAEREPGRAGASGAVRLSDNGARLRRLPPCGKERPVSGRDLRVRRRRTHAAVAQW